MDKISAFEIILFTIDLIYNADQMDKILPRFKMLADVFANMVN